MDRPHSEPSSLAPRDRASPILLSIGPMGLCVKHMPAYYRKRAIHPPVFSRGMNGLSDLQTLLKKDVIATWSTGTSNRVSTLSCTTSSGVPAGGGGCLSGQYMTVCSRSVTRCQHEHNWQVVPLAIQPHHVHVFIRANPYTLPADIPRLITGRSAYGVAAKVPPPAQG